MTEEHYFHMFANGDDAKNFITSEQEFVASFNRFGVCAYATGVIVLSFSVENSHPHALLRGTMEKCTKFKNMYESMSIRSIVQNRGSSDGVVLRCTLDEISDERYLKNAAAYTIIQATKDGRPVMPYDYRYGTGALYFRTRYSILPWLVDDKGLVSTPVRFGSLSAREKHRHCGSRILIPDDWLVCNGFILPQNYVSVSGFESIYKTHNCFRVFLSNNNKDSKEVIQRMADVRGVLLDDNEARRLCAGVCWSMFGKYTSRHLTVDDRLELARALRVKYRLSFRQLAILARVPESELRKYVL